MSRAQQTAAEAYAEHAAAIRTMLARLGSELRGHAEEAASDPGNWVYAGDLETLRAELHGAIAYFTQDGEVDRSGPGS